MTDPLTPAERAAIRRRCEYADAGVDVLQLGIQPEHVLRMEAALVAAEAEVARLSDAIDDFLSSRAGYASKARALSRLRAALAPSQDDA